ncbi:MAG: hypothetical protein ACHQUC_10370, partial [Chlamydiales bacterium]
MKARPQFFPRTKTINSGTFIDSLLSFDTNISTVNTNKEIYCLNKSLTAVKKPCKTTAPMDLVLSEINTLIGRIKFAKCEKPISAERWEEIREHIVVYSNSYPKKDPETIQLQSICSTINDLIGSIDPLSVAKPLIAKPASELTEIETHELLRLLISVGEEKVLVGNILCNSVAAYWKYLLIEHFHKNGGVTKTVTSNGGTAIDWKKIKNLSAEETAISIGLQQGFGHSRHHINALMRNVLEEKPHLDPETSRIINLWMLHYTTCEMNDLQEFFLSQPEGSLMTFDRPAEVVSRDAIREF